VGLWTHEAVVVPVHHVHDFLELSEIRAALLLMQS
jgi:hypothetical protein